MISILVSFVKLILWPHLRSVLENFPCLLKKHVSCAAICWSSLLMSVRWNLMISVLIFPDFLSHHFVHYQQKNREISKYNHWMDYFFPGGLADFNLRCFWDPLLALYMFIVVVMPFWCTDPCLPHIPSLVALHTYISCHFLKARWLQRVIPSYMASGQ